MFARQVLYTRVTPPAKLKELGRNSGEGPEDFLCTFMEFLQNTCM
jgi:hypothetical protein